LIEERGPIAMGANLVGILAQVHAQVK